MQSLKNVSIQKIPVMSKAQKVQYFVLIFFGILITSLFASWWFTAIHIPHNFSGIFHFFDFALFAVLSCIVWYQIINEVFFWDYVGSMKKPKALRPQKNLKVAFLTAFVPDKEPIEILEKTLRAMFAVSYPHDTWVLDEGDNTQVKNLCKKLNVKHFSRKNVEKYNQHKGTFKLKTKAGNYNAWFDLHSSKYEIVAQLDVDFVPHKNFLTETLGFFKDQQVAFVGTPQIYGNQSDSWIAKGAAEQAYNFHGPVQKGLYGKDMPLFIGANHLIRISAHNDINGYAGHIVEDHLTGMKFYAKKWKSVYLPQILAVGQGPANWEAYFSQQMRWAYGLFHILFTQSPRLLTKMKLKHAVNYFWLQQYYFYGLAQAASICLLTAYFFWGITATYMNILDLIVLYGSLLSVQLTIFSLFQKYNIDPQNESGLHLRGRLLAIAAWPIYFWAFVSVIFGKKLSYRTTPKGTIDTYTPNISLFIPHFLLGTITLLDLIASFYTGNNAPQLRFWAITNTGFMYYFFGREVFEYAKSRNLNIFSLNPSLFAKKSFGLRQLD
jgi:cellulose synthase/poly-beta-1,6-N-acetylglucosamine synthase-like glycosyltransferase